MFLPHRLKLLLFFASLAFLGLPTARGHEVLRQVQEELRKRKVYFGDIDGRDTSELRAALSHYQGARGLRATGQVSRETLDTLDIAEPVGELSLPEGVVLRSDYGVRSPVEIPPAPPPPVSTPVAPPAPEPEKGVSPQRVKAFIVRYLEDSENPDLEAETRHYASRVDYFHHGEQSAKFVRKDVQDYRERWPERKFKLVGPFKVELVEEGVYAATFRVQYEVRGPRDPARGQAEERFTIDTRPAKWEITGMKEQRVRS